MTTISVLTASAAISGVASRIFCHPIDTVKSRMQAPGGGAGDAGRAAATFRDVLNNTFKREGVRGLYRGFGAVILGGTPGTVLYLTSYEKIKGWLGEENVAVHFTSGILAEAVACVIYVPVDVVKERLQVQRGGGGEDAASKYRGSVDAFLKISRQEGVGGIYKGYGATLLSYGPFSAFYFLFYESFKKEARKHVGVEELPFHHVVGTSALAGSVASFITSPLDMAKLRLQVQRGGMSTTNYRNIGHGLREIFNEGGVALLWRGATARMAFHAPSTAISMTTFEMCKRYFGGDNK